jgi:hypothetical protein
MRKLIILVAVAAGVAAGALALWQAAPSPAIDQTNEKPAPLGLVGLTEGQVLRVSVAYVTGFDPQPDPPGCTLKVGFADADGNAVGDPNIFELAPGGSDSLDHLAIGDPHIRDYVRPVVVDLNPQEECPAVATIEVLDREGINGIIIHDTPVLLDAWLKAK